MAKKPRFVLDVHLGKLARYLRMLGFDALWRDDYSDPQILEIRKRQRRIVLTRDRRLLEEHVRKGGYRVEAVYPREQLEEIVRQFRLKTKIDPFTVCMECNGKIREVRKAEVEGRLHPDTGKYFDRFYACTECRRVYWHGSHYERMLDLIDGLREK